MPCMASEPPRWNFCARPARAFLIRYASGDLNGFNGCIVLLLSLNLTLKDRQAGSARRIGVTSCHQFELSGIAESADRDAHHRTRREEPDRELTAVSMTMT